MIAKSHFKYFVIAILVIAFDQITKYFAYAGKLGGFLNSFRPVFGKLLMPNYNFAFSIPLPHIIAYIVYAAVLVGFIRWYFLNKKTTVESVGFYLVIGGAASNIIDRVYLGFVRDFILAFWGNIFNFADVAIVAGITLIIYKSFYKSELATVKK